MIIPFDSDGLDADDAQMLDVHQHMPRGMEPSADVWQRVLTGTEARADIRNPRAFGPDSAQSGKDSVMSATLATPRRESLDRSANKKSWKSWVSVAAAIAITMALAFNAIGFLGNGRPDDNGHLALAPRFGTPGDASTPPPAVPTPGPEYACTAPALTEEEVMAIVMNPQNGLERLGMEMPQSDGLSEWTNDSISYEAHNFPVGGSPSREENEEISAAADMFWNCLMTGTAFQVWGLMDPSIVQSEVLINFPVLRTEEQLRNHVHTFGPMRYSAGLGQRFPDLGGIDPVQASARTSGDPADTRMIGSVTYPDTYTARIAMFPHPDSGSARSNFLYLYLTRYPNGQWIVTGIDFPNAGG